jgi:hypothetical protein
LIKRIQKIPRKENGISLPLTDVLEQPKDQSENNPPAMPVEVPYNRA